MISFKDSAITQILPDNLNKEIDVIAISYSIGEQIKKIIEKSSQIGLYSMLDNIFDNNILDTMAIEMGTQYYDNSLPLEKKRELIKNTLKWYCKSGTTGSVNELISVVFGQGSIKEWFEYGGKEFYFKIETSEILTEDKLNQFNTIIQNVKNFRSRLEGFDKFERKKSTNYIASCRIKLKWKCIRGEKNVSR